MSANRSRRVGPLGTWSAAADCALAGRAVKLAKAATASHRSTLRRLTTRFIFGTLEDRDLPVVRPLRWTHALANCFVEGAHFPVCPACSAFPCIPEDFKISTAQERFGVPRPALRPCYHHPASQCPPSKICFCRPPVASAFSVNYWDLLCSFSLRHYARNLLRMRRTSW